MFIITLLLNTENDVWKFLKKSRYKIAKIKIFRKLKFRSSNTSYGCDATVEIPFFQICVKIEWNVFNPDWPPMMQNCFRQRRKNGSKNSLHSSTVVLLMIQKKAYRTTNTAPPRVVIVRLCLTFFCRIHIYQTVYYLTQNYFDPLFPYPNFPSNT